MYERTRANHCHRKRRRRRHRRRDDIRRQTNIININSVINNTTVQTRTIIDIFDTRLRVGGQTLSNILSDFAITLRDY